VGITKRRKPLKDEVAQASGERSSDNENGLQKKRINHLSAAKLNDALPHRWLVNGWN